jgi:Flp pilus assembly protein TadD
MIQLCREEEGIKIISDFLEKSPEVWNAWFLMGWGYRRTGRFEEGYNAFRKVLDLGERSADALNEIAICSIVLGKTGEAEK